MRRSLRRTGATPAAATAKSTTARVGSPLQRDLSGPPNDTKQKPGDTINIEDYFTIEIGKDWTRETSKRRLDEFSSELLNASYDEPYVVVSVQSVTNLFKGGVVSTDDDHLQNLLAIVRRAWEKRLDVPVLEDSISSTTVSGIPAIVVNLGCLIGENKLKLRCVVLNFPDGTGVRFAHSNNMLVSNDL